MNRKELIGDGPNQLVPAETVKGGRFVGKRKPRNRARGGQWSGRTRK